MHPEGFEPFSLVREEVARLEAELIRSCNLFPVALTVGGLCECGLGCLYYLRSIETFIQ